MNSRPRREKETTKIHNESLKTKYIDEYDTVCPKERDVKV